MQPISVVRCQESSIIPDHPAENNRHKRQPDGIEICLNPQQNNVHGVENVELCRASP